MYENWLQHVPNGLIHLNNICIWGTEYILHWLFELQFKFSRYLSLYYTGVPLYHIDGLVQERRNSSALAMELCLSCTNPSICKFCAKSSKYTFTYARSSC